MSSSSTSRSESFVSRVERGRERVVRRGQHVHRPGEVDDAAVFAGDLPQEAALPRLRLGSTRWRQWPARAELRTWSEEP